mmetsp:Transcript_71087/g.164352  ORF Transcript_71087/g.164352 Transcript_71087/m.164352 type:complete len:278 (-) Transcript_71087:1283-2116(-)
MFVATFSVHRRARRRSFPPLVVDRCSSHVIAFAPDVAAVAASAMAVAGTVSLAECRRPAFAPPNFSHLRKVQEDFLQRSLRDCVVQHAVGQCATRGHGSLQEAKDFGQRHILLLLLGADAITEQPHVLFSETGTRHLLRHERADAHAGVGAVIVLVLRLRLHCERITSTVLGFQLERRAQALHLTAGHDGEPCAEYLAFIHGVAREHKGMAMLTDGAKHIPQEAPCTNVHARRGLVQQHNVRLTDESNGRGELAPVAATELVAEAVLVRLQAHARNG